MLIHDSLNGCAARKSKTEHSIRTNQEMSLSQDVVGLSNRWIAIDRDSGQSSVSFALGSACERLLAFLLLVLASPILLIAVLLVRLTSHGPAIYSQARVGRGGRAFILYKLRTMRHRCELQSGPRWSVPGDPRVTPVGRFLRRTHLDELPQLWNICRGDMRLVGPRPERPEFVVVLERQLPLYNLRLHVTPGLTGLAQVQLPPDTDLGSVRRKLACDVYYVRCANWWLDMRILAATALKIVGLPPSLRRVLFRLPGGPTVENAFEDLEQHIPLAPALNSAG